MAKKPAKTTKKPAKKPAAKPAAKPAKRPVKPVKAAAKTAAKVNAGVLTDQQKLFVAEYLKDFNGKQAATRAGYSAKTAEAQASRMLSQPKLERQVERATYDSDRVLARLVDEVEADLADLYDDDGNLLPMREWPLIWRKGLVAGIEVEEVLGASEEDGKPKPVIALVRKIKLSDRTRRLEMIGKHTNVQAFKENKKVEFSDPLEALAREIIGQSVKPKAAGAPADDDAPRGIRPKDDA
ncbi:terminase small subunit [Allomesorhizobium alhagi]|uniref:Terminase small subunit n=1 Tax=Mesorhizobium alhagi CCNWXJ12-2 TaxID=1107882 RepID=H0HNJ6_9HYPH|nr:terminase small subunit [Mesorhizobium alhagi]EHK57649.1 terminase small subunit [Mesorhizobium alhagi CCNWXJ12-2]